ncbi:MAG: response regulator [Planctomycetaceae bacterium]|nr:response regulator [Planctomycetaceae bacterium]
MKTNAESVLDEIRSTIASFESMRRTTRTAPTASKVQSLSGDSTSISSNKPAVERRGRPVAAPEYAATTQQDQQALDESVSTDPSMDSGQLPPDEMIASGDSVAPACADPVRSRVKASRGEAASCENVLNQVFRRRAVDKSAKVMIVDDEPLNIMTFRQHLKMEGYERFVTTSDPREALHMLRAELPDVCLLDIRMPEVSGIEILRVISLDPILQHIPVLILTAATDPETRRQALDLGASDFLQKPIDPNELIPRVRNALLIKKHYDMIASEASKLEKQVERRTRELEATRQQLILCLARAAEHRDNDTGNHVIRVGRYAALIASQMDYPSERLEMLEQAAQLHDVGKIGVPDSILFKPGRLDPDEYSLMKRHCSLGKQIIEPISEKEWAILKAHTRIGESMLHVRSSSLLMLAARIAQTHHERWDGKGYPLGLKGDDIPLEGRIVAVADVFDALSSKRPYKDPMPREKCFEILQEGRGTQFDPAVIDAFFECSEEIIETQITLMDDEVQIPKNDWERIAAAVATENAS